MPILADVFKQLGVIMRYLLAPVVGLAVVWAFSTQPDMLAAAVRATSFLGPASAPIPFLVLLAVGGLAVYYGHRTVLHPILSWVQLRLLNRKQTVKPRAEDLAFDRWQRRGSPPATPVHAVQHAIDEASSASHFFYCAGWAAILAVLVFSRSPAFGLTSTLCFGGVVALLIVLGIVGDWRTTKWDLTAYRLEWDATLPIKRLKLPT